MTKQTLPCSSISYPTLLISFWKIEAGLCGDELKLLINSLLKQENESFGVQ
jgi:hypothetical protein